MNLKTSIVAFLISCLFYTLTITVFATDKEASNESVAKKTTKIGIGTSNKTKNTTGTRKVNKPVIYDNNVTVTDTQTITKENVKKICKPVIAGNSIKKETKPTRIRANIRKQKAKISNNKTSVKITPIEVQIVDGVVIMKKAKS